jgi:hypothetical protein
MSTDSVPPPDSRARVRDDPEWEAAVRALRTAWRDLTRRRVALMVLRALAQR